MTMRWRAYISAMMFLVVLGGGRARAQSSETPSARQRNDVEIEALLARFRGEPSVRAVQSAALRHGGLDAADLEGWRARARWSNLVPVLEGQMAWSGAHDESHSFHEDLETLESGRIRHDDARNEYADDASRQREYALEIDLDLRGLVFDADEIDVAHASRERLKARAELVTDVTKLYFDRRKKQVLRLLTPRSKWRKQLELTLAIRRYTARLDAFTGGWFSKQLDASRPGGF